MDTADAITFMFTDLEGSTRLWEQHPQAMRDALVRHDAIVRGSIEGSATRTVEARLSPCIDAPLIVRSNWMLERRSFAQRRDWLG